MLSRREMLSASLATSMWAREDWAERKKQTLLGMEAVMGPLPPKSEAPLDVRILEEKHFPAFTRQRLSYSAGDGSRVRTFLFLPNRPGRLPAFLHLHQTNAFGKAEVAGVAGRANRQFVPEQAQMGYVVLAPDYPYFGEAAHLNPYELGYQSGTMKGIVNHRRALDLLCAMPQVNPHRITAIGHSLGGHNSLFLAAFDDRAGAIVTSCGFTSFAHYYGGDLTGWSSDRYMPKIATEYGKDPARMPFDFPGILAALAPRPLFINAPLHDANFDVTGVRHCVELAQQAYNARQAGERLLAVYPDCEHDFPPEIRRQAYAFLRRHGF